MNKVFVISVVFFVVELLLFQWGQPFIIKSLTSEPVTRLKFTAKQRRLINYLSELDQLNHDHISSVFVIGGSTLREFFLPDTAMSEILGRPFVNMASANQNMFDAIRLVDNINIKGSTVIFCIFPYKLMTRIDQSVLTGTKYMMGQSLKYPVISREVNALLDNYSSRDLLINLLPEINIYVYLTRDFFSHKRYLGNNPVAHLLLPELESQTITSLLITDKPPVQHYYKSLDYMDRKKVLQTFKWMKKTKIGPDFEKNIGSNLSLLAKAVDIGRNKGLNMLVLELPYSSYYRREFSEEIIIYSELLNIFLKKNKDIKHIAFDYDEYQGEESFFYDYAHLADAGRNYFTPIALKKIKNELTASN